MKNLILSNVKYISTLLILTASLFAQDTLKFKQNENIYTGKVQEIHVTRVKFLIDGSNFANIIKIANIEYLSTPDTALIKDGIVLSRPVVEEAPWPPPGVLTRIGGGFIVASGVLTFSINSDAEKSRNASLEEIEDMLDSSIDKGKLSAVFLIIGGALIAVDR